MDRNRLLPRLTQVLLAAATWCALFLPAGCGSTASEDYRTVSEADVENDLDDGSDAAQRSDEQETSTTRAKSGGPDALSEDPPTAQAQDSSSATTPVAQATDSVSTQDPKSGSTISPGETASAESHRAEATREATPIEVTLADSPPPTAPGVETPDRPVKLLVPEQTFSVEGPDGALRISYDDFDLEKVLNVTIAPPDIVQHFPDWLNGLDGKRVRVRGFMYPTFQETDLGGFVLARDYGVCCFGPQGKIYHLVEVAMREGETTDYIHARPFDVVGEFHIRPDADGEELLQLYQIEDAIVIEQ